MEQVRRADEARLEVAAGGDKVVELRCRLGNVGLMPKCDASTQAVWVSYSGRILPPSIYSLRNASIERCLFTLYVSASPPQSSMDLISNSLE